MKIWDESGFAELCRKAVIVKQIRVENWKATKKLKMGEDNYDDEVGKEVTIFFHF